jgi:hypothetical protein
MILGRSSLVALTSLLLACSDPFTPPAGTLTGTFGGPQLELNFGTRIVQASLGCSGTYFRGPILPDANGDFMLQSTPLLGDQYSSVQIEIRGRVLGDQIVATLITTTRGGSSTEQKTLTRGSKGDFASACALS